MARVRSWPGRFTSVRTISTSSVVPMSHGTNGATDTERHGHTNVLLCSGGVIEYDPTQDSENDIDDEGRWTKLGPFAWNPVKNKPGK